MRARTHACRIAAIGFIMLVTSGCEHAKVGQSDSIRPASHVTATAPPTGPRLPKKWSPRCRGKILAIICYIGGECLLDSIHEGKWRCPPLPDEVLDTCVARYGTVV
jgi:hypothetical protein